MSISMDVEGSVAEPHRIDHGSPPEVFVLFTSEEQTIKALKKAGDLARPIGAKIVVLVTQIVPYQLQLDEPPVSLKFLIRRFENIASQYPAKTEVRVCFCRIQLVMLKSILKSDSPVVLGTRKRWWPTHEARLARMLRQAGYEVILVETELTAPRMPAGVLRTAGSSARQ